MRKVLSAIRATAARDPDRVALQDDQGTMSYAQLAEAIAVATANLSACPDVVALLMPRGRDHVIADLALASLGRTIVPLPDFFSTDQIRHVVSDSCAMALVCVADLHPGLAELKLPLFDGRPQGDRRMVTAEASKRVVYTSGTTGAPKGVHLTEKAMEHALSGLVQAAAAGPDDVHLSLLPPALLLEQLAGIFAPLSVAARVCFGTSPAQAEDFGATTTVLTPDILAAWSAGLQMAGRRAPQSLRFVAVGGAVVGPELAERAWALGIPVHEGYGLSECCSVVAVNRAGERKAGTVGRVLDGTAIRIEDGEIVVTSASVMTGYLHHPPVSGEWRTGDLGQIDEDGYLTVLGRKDDVIVTAAGRNIHPEWIETLIATDQAVARCAVFGQGDGVAVLVVPDPRAAGIDWSSRVDDALRPAPAYAWPKALHVMGGAQAQALGFFTLDGRPRRRRISEHFKREVAVSFYEHLLAETALDRAQFLSIPLIGRALNRGVDKELYLAFLNCAYHHVRYTVPLMRAAAQRCGSTDQEMVAGLADYVEEEIGHEEWILNDIRDLGGDWEKTRNARPPLPVRAMVAMAFHQIEEDGPYALLGLVHVLEGMSAALAVAAAESIRRNLGLGDAVGFSYLKSHGILDIDHVDGFASLLSRVDTPERRQIVVAAAKDFYALYGDVFRALDSRFQEADHAA